MENQEFIVLYTHQKMKKSKVWQDGILKITPLGNKAILYDDKGACLESLFLKCLEVKPGDDLESDRYLITVEEVKMSGSITIKQNVIKEPQSDSRRFISYGRSLGCQPAGLKRKFPGFQAPRQVPKKMVLTENGESAASLESKEPGPTFSSPFYNIPPLFSTVGKQDINNIPRNSENIVTYNIGERNNMTSPSVVSASSFMINPEMLAEENYFCSPVSTESQHSDSSLTNEPLRRDNLALHYPGVSQNIRSKAQILALLKSKSTNMHKDLNSEMTRLLPQVQPQRSSNIPANPKYLIQLEACAEMKSTDQHQSENTMRNKSRWAMYLSSQSSPVHSCTVEGSNIEWKPEAQEDDINLNLKDLLVQERMQDFETCDEKGKKDNEDQPVDNTDQSWNQEEKVEILSFCESSSLLGSCSSADNNGLLSESNIQGNNEIPSNQNDKVCMEGSVCIGESAQVVNTCTTQQEHKQPVSSLLESEHLQMESFLSNKSRISNGVPDVFSKSSIDSESLNSVHGSVSNVTEPFLEINFNLSNFETSDTETESQEDNKISQDSERWVKEILAHDGNLCVQKRSEDTSCQEIGSECLPLLTSIDSRPADIFPIKETISQFCDKTCVGFDMGPYKDGNTGKETEEEYINTLSNFDSSLDWNDDVYIDNKEDANNSIKKVGINCDFASLSDKSKGINMNLHFPQFLDTVTNQSPKNDALFSEDVQPQTFILGSDLDKSDEQILPPISSSDKSIQLLTTNQEYVACDRFDTQDSNSLFYPLEKKHPISKDSEVYIPESEDSGRIGKLLHGHIEVATARKSKQSWNNSRNSSLSGVISNISLLKSLSEHSTALESLEILKKRNTAFQQQGIQQTYEPDSRPEARKPFTTVVSHMIPKSPDLKQDSQKILKEDEVEPHESFRSLQVEPGEGEEKRKSHEN